MPSSNPPPPKTAGKRRRFSEDFKLGAVELAGEIGFRQAAADLGVNQGNIRNWSKALTESDGLTDKDRLTDIECELAAVREENRLLKRERELLKKAAAFFAKESE